jgi:hypothetical protein
MTERLFLSLWLRRPGNSHAFDQAKLLTQFGKMLGLFPLSMLSARGPAMRIQAISRAEPPIFEHDLPAAGDREEAVEEILESAREFMHEDCLCEVDAAWDLWQYDLAQSRGDWKLAPTGVTLACFGPDFEDEVGDHLRIEFGFDSHFLPDPEIEASPRMAESNPKSLVHLVRELEQKLELDRRLLWSESGENPVELLVKALEESGAY